MNFAILSTTWAQLTRENKILIVTQAPRMALAKEICRDNAPFVREIELLDADKSDYKRKMRKLKKEDLLLVLLTMDGFMQEYRKDFSPFEPPKGVKSRYIFIRLDIPRAALLSGLNTDLGKLADTVQALEGLQVGMRVHVTAPGGTDITLTVARKDDADYHPLRPGEDAFLPPSEVSHEVSVGSANGVIVTDVTVGEIRFGAELIDPLGLPDSPVTITVENGLIAGITGGETAQRLAQGLNRLDSSLQKVVELGHGLSDLEATGIIGVDESMSGTCHFGIGDRNPYHVDVVVAEPTIIVLE